MTICCVGWFLCGFGQIFQFDWHWLTPEVMDLFSIANYLQAWMLPHLHLSSLYISSWYDIMCIVEYKFRLYIHSCSCVFECAIITYCRKTYHIGLDINTYYVHIQIHRERERQKVKNKNGNKYVYAYIHIYVYIHIYIHVILYTHIIYIFFW